MRCDEARDRLADRLDDLLTAVDSAAVDEHLAACPPCAERARDLREIRSVLYRPDDPGPPPPDLRERILAASSRRRGPRLPALVRYAAVFLLGVGVTLALMPGPRVVEVPVERVVLERPVPDPSAETVVQAPRVPRRIR